MVPHQGNSSVQYSLSLLGELWTISDLKSTLIKISFCSQFLPTSSRFTPFILFRCFRILRRPSLSTTLPSRRETSLPIFRYRYSTSRFRSHPHSMSMLPPPLPLRAHGRKGSLGMAQARSSDSNGADLEIGFRRRSRLPFGCTR